MGLFSRKPKELVVPIAKTIYHPRGIAYHHEIDMPLPSTPRAINEHLEETLGKCAAEIKKKHGRPLEVTVVQNDPFDFDPVNQELIAKTVAAALRKHRRVQRIRVVKESTARLRNLKYTDEENHRAEEILAKEFANEYDKVYENRELLATGVLEDIMSRDVY